MNTTKHVVLLTSNIFGRGFDSRRLHHYELLNIKRQKQSDSAKVPIPCSRFIPATILPTFQEIMS